MMQPRALAATDPVAPTPATLDSRARLEAMFEAHHQVVWRTLRRAGLDPQTAADVGQQAFVVAIERIADIWPGSERAFLVGTALRLSRRLRSKASRVVLDPELAIPSCPGQHAESQVIALQLLDRVLAQLDPTLAEVFVLFDVEGFSAPEISQALELPVGTVASRLRRAREYFRLAVGRLERVWKREEGER
jgi:RNA polymerase sigma-70 factor, ECF subfamily